MAKWIESAVTFNKIQENGTVRKVTEKYLFDALSFTECESRTIEELTPYISGEFSVKAVKKTKISEIFFDDSADDRFYLVCVGFINIDDKTGVEKRTISQILVQANNFINALERFNEGMKGTMADIEIVSMTETPYIGVYPISLPAEVK